MSKSQNPYRHVRLVLPDDADYLAYLRRMRDRRPTRTGRRNAGEFIGGLVEKTARHWLSGFVPLQPERILTWEQRLQNNRNGSLYREIDGVWRIDEESLCLYEIKFTFPENMEKATGIKQLRVACDILANDPQYRYLLKRLVYIVEEPLELDLDIPIVEPNDEYEEVGIIWVPFDAIETAAHALELELPTNWREPEAREGHLENPEQDEWRQFAETEAEEDYNPLADALRRAMDPES